MNSNTYHQPVTYLLAIKGDENMNTGMNVDLLKYFSEISKIPRGSGNEKGISDYLVAFAAEHGLKAIQDEALNVIIKKKASPGYEGRSGIVLQAHMDMVCEKNKDKEHDFLKDPLTLKAVGDMLYADNTTLGADDGIGMAMILAVLADHNAAHPDLEALFTTDEERGMKGAESLNPEEIKGRVLINLDSDQEGRFFVSCAGGPVVKTTIPVVWEEADYSKKACILKIRGLIGGHSGSDIDKGRANSNKLMGRLLKEIDENFDFDLALVDGGIMYNAIPREADAIMLIDQKNFYAISRNVENLSAAIKKEFETIDPDVEIIFESMPENDRPSMIFSEFSKACVLNYLYLSETGINTMSSSIKGLVESSLSLGTVKTGNASVDFTILIRSSVKSLQKDLYGRVVTLAKLCNGNAAVLADCPLWEYKPDSKILRLCEKVYRRQYCKEPEITAVHVGLECGIFDQKFNGEMDMISFGPDIFEYHTPSEHFSISSAIRSYEFLLELLKEI